MRPSSSSSHGNIECIATWKWAYGCWGKPMVCQQLCCCLFLGFMPGMKWKPWENTDAGMPFWAAAVVQGGLRQWQWQWLFKESPQGLAEPWGCWEQLVSEAHTGLPVSLKASYYGNMKTNTVFFTSGMCASPQKAVGRPDRLPWCRTLGSGGTCQGTAQTVQCTTPVSHAWRPRRGRLSVC